MELIKKIVIFGVFPLLIVALAVWAFLSTAGSNEYEYQGYVVALRQTEDGTAITTVIGGTQSEFVIKRNTKQIFNGELTELKECAFIRLSTTRNSDTQVKRFTAYEGYSLEGKIVFLEGSASPFLLAYDPSLNYTRLFELIPSQETTISLQTGTMVKVYYQYPINASTEKIVVDVIQGTTDQIIAPTEDEIAFIGRMGHTVSGK